MYFKGPVVVAAAAAVGTATSTGSGLISACFDPTILFSNRRNALVTCGGRSAKGRVAACARVMSVDSATSGTAGADRGIFWTTSEDNGEDGSRHLPMRGADICICT